MKTWGKDICQKDIPHIDYKSAKSDKTLLLQWLKSLYRYGFAKMTGGKIESGALIQVADLFGYVRETNYGKWFEIRSEINATNLAYTNLGLQAHTDNPSRSSSDYTNSLLFRKFCFWRRLNSCRWFLSSYTS